MSAEQQQKLEFLQQYESIHSSFMKYCKARAMGRMDTEDLMQETVLRTLIGWESIQDSRNLLPFMIGVANNIIRNHLRQYPGTKLDITDFQERLAGFTTDPEVSMDIQIMYEAILRLKPQEQEILLLFEVSGYSIKEIADLMQVSEGSVKTRLHRIRKKLRTRLSDRHITEERVLQAVSLLFLLITQVP